MAGRRDVEAGSAYVRLWMKSSEFDRGVRTLKRNLTGIGRDLTRVGGVIAGAGTAIVGSITAAAVSFAGFGDTLNKMAIRTGVSTEALSELKFAAEQSGASLEVVEKGIRKMQQTIGEAASGGQSYIDALGNIGLSLDKLSGKSPEDQFMLIAERVAAISDPTMRAAAALEIFGRSGTQLLPLMTGDVRKLREEARKLGLTMSEEDAQAAADLTDAINRMKKSMEAAWNKIGASVAPMLETLADRVANLAVTSQEWIEANGDMVVTLLKVGAGLAAVGTALIAFGQLAYGAAAAIGMLSTALTFIAAHPALIAIGALTAAAAYFATASDRAAASAGRLAAEQDKLLRASDQQRANDLAKVRRLEELSAKQSLTNDETGEASKLIDELEKSYGALGIRLDETTGKLEGVAGGFQLVTTAMREQRRDELKAAIAAKQAEITAAEQNLSPGMMNPLDIFSGNARSAYDAEVRSREAALNARQAELGALVNEYQRLASGNVDALAGNATPTPPTTGTPSSVAPPAGYDFDNMGPGLWEQVDFEEMREEADAYFADIRQQEEAARRKADANQRFADDTKRLEIEQGITDEKEKQRRLVEFEREIALRGVGAEGADADKINAYYDVRLAGIKDVVKQQGQAVGPSGTFSTAAAAAMTGRAGGSPEERTAKGVEAMVKGNTGLLNMLARLVGLTESQTDELKKIFSFG